ncbi:MAG: TorF family putative porin [Sulfuricaulis sp.]
MLRAAVTLLGLLFACEVLAQVSGSLSLVSDYRFRGESLSDEQPAAQLSVAYDHPRGWYAGAFGSTIQLANQSSRNLQVLAYAGYARRAASGLSWEMGADYSAFSGAGAYDYAEVYSGIASDNVSARIYYAPDYFGQSSGTSYAELNGTRRFQNRLRWLGHVGILRRGSPRTATDGSSRYRFDVQTGMGIDLDRTSIQLTWVGTRDRKTIYSAEENQNRSAFVLSVSWAF